MIFALKIILFWTVFSFVIWFGDPIRLLIRYFMLDRWFKGGHRSR